MKLYESKKENGDVCGTLSRTCDYGYWVWRVFWFSRYLEG